jgi:hypothetical protein
LDIRENHSEFLKGINWLNTTILSDPDEPSDFLTKGLNPVIEDPQGTLIVVQLLEKFFLLWNPTFHNIFIATEP